MDSASLNLGRGSSSDPSALRDGELLRALTVLSRSISLSAKSSYWVLAGAAVSPGGGADAAGTKSGVLAAFASEAEILERTLSLGASEGAASF